jgi:AraC-like DNA-binding protein
MVNGWSIMGAPGRRGVVVAIAEGDPRTCRRAAGSYARRRAAAARIPRTIGGVAHPAIEQVSEQAIGRPAPRLRPYVSSYVGYRMEGFAPGFHAGLPSRSITFIVSLGEPVELVAERRADAPADRFDGLVGGLHDRPALIRHHGDQHGVQLDVTPLGARRLLGAPSAALAGQVVTVEELLGPLARELGDRLRAGATWAERFAVVDDVLGRALGDADDPGRPGPAPEVVAAWDRLVALDGAIEIGALAREVGWSRRHLGERFRVEVGLPPKVLARVLRFERSRKLLVVPDRRPLAWVAAECGYADQAHLAREWVQLAGSSPSAWLAAEELPFVQDDPPLDRSG